MDPDNTAEGRAFGDFGLLPYTPGLSQRNRPNFVVWRLPALSQSFLTCKWSMCYRPQALYTFLKSTYPMSLNPLPYIPHRVHVTSIRFEAGGVPDFLGLHKKSPPRTTLRGGGMIFFSPRPEPHFCDFQGPVFASPPKLPVPRPR